MKRNMRAWLGGAVLAAGCLAGPAWSQADEVDTPVEPDQTVPAQPPVSTPPPPEAAVPERERLVRVGEKPRRKRLVIGPELGVYLPSASRTRERFGDAWWGVGVGFSPIRRTETPGRTSLEVSVINNDRGRNRAFLVPIGLVYRRALTPGTGARPYAGVSGDLLFTYFRSRDDNIGYALRAGAGASALLGSTFGDRGYIEARYFGLSKVKGFNFSGLDVAAGVRF